MAPPLKLSEGAVIGCNNVNSGAENIGNENVAKLYGSFDANAVDNLHTIKNPVFGKCTRGFAGNNVENAALNPDGCGKASYGIYDFCSGICIASFAGVACDGNNCAVVVKLNGNAAAHGAGYANNILLHLNHSSTEISITPPSAKPLSISFLMITLSISPGARRGRFLLIRISPLYFTTVFAFL